MAARGHRKRRNRPRTRSTVNVTLPYAHHCCKRCGWTPIEGMAKYQQIHDESAVCIRCGLKLRISVYELGDCGISNCRGVTKQVNHDYCRECQKLFEK